MGCSTFIEIPCQKIYSRVIKPCVGHIKPVKIEIAEPVTICKMFIQAEFPENLAFRDILYACLGVPIIHCDKHILFGDTIHCCLKVAIELVRCTTVGQEG